MKKEFKENESNGMWNSVWGQRVLCLDGFCLNSSCEHLTAALLCRFRKPLLLLVQASFGLTLRTMEIEQEFTGKN